MTSLWNTPIASFPPWGIRSIFGQICMQYVYQKCSEVDSGSRFARDCMSLISRSTAESSKGNSLVKFGVYGKDKEFSLKSACLTLGVCALFWSSLVNEGMYIYVYIFKLYTMCTSYARCALQTLRTLYTSHTTVPIPTT